MRIDHKYANEKILRFIKKYENGRESLANAKDLKKVFLESFIGSTHFACHLY